MAAPVAQVGSAYVEKVPLGYEPFSIAHDLPGHDGLAHPHPAMAAEVKAFVNDRPMGWPRRWYELAVNFLASASRMPRLLADQLHQQSLLSFNERGGIITCMDPTEDMPKGWVKTVAKPTRESLQARIAELRTDLAEAEAQLHEMEEGA